MARGLTKRQKDIYDFIGQFIDENGYPPTLREICAGFGMASTRAASDHLEALERKGMITRTPDRSRAIVIPERVAGHAARVIPLIGKIAAGAPLLAVENVIDRLAVDDSLARGTDNFMLEVEGESMIGAHILPGDRIVVKRQEDANDGEIVVALLGDEATVKRLEKRGSRIRLIPENPAMEPIPIRDKEQFRILGIVTGLIRRIR